MSKNEDEKLLEIGKNKAFWLTVNPKICYPKYIQMRQAHNLKRRVG